MNILNSIFGKKGRKSTAGSTNTPPTTQAGWTGMRQIVPACNSVPSLRSMDVSPDENLVGCLTPDNRLVVHESGADQPKWDLKILSSENSNFRFISPDRLLLASPDNMDKPTDDLYQLINSANGTVIARAKKEHMRTEMNVDLSRRCVVTEDVNAHEIVTIHTAGDRVEMSSWKSDNQIDTTLPRLGPDGKIYYFLFNGLYRLDGDTPTRVMPGRACVYFEPPAKIYCGEGYHDRSGSGNLNILNLDTGETSSVNWGVDPVSQIAPAGKGDLIITSCCGGTFDKSFNAHVSRYAVEQKSKVWSFSIDDLPWGQFIHYPLLLSVPEEGWALIQTGHAIKMIDLKDGKTISQLPQEFKHWVDAKWLASKRLLYLSSASLKSGTMECFKL
jgi:hypothetical protein